MEFLLVDWFRDEAVKPVRQNSLAILSHHARGQGDHRRLLKTRHLPDLVECVDSADVRQRDIHEDDIWTMLGEQLKTGLRIGRAQRNKLLR